MAPSMKEDSKMERNMEMDILSGQMGRVIMEILMKMLLREEVSMRNREEVDMRGLAIYE